MSTIKPLGGAVNSLSGETVVDGGESRSSCRKACSGSGEPQCILRVRDGLLEALLHKLTNFVIFLVPAKLITNQRQ